MPHKIGINVVPNWVVSDTSHTLVTNIWSKWMRFLLMFLLAHYPFLTFKCSNTSSHCKVAVSNSFSFELLVFNCLRYAMFHNFFCKLWIIISHLIFNVNCPPHSANNKLANLFNFLPLIIVGCPMYIIWIQRGHGVKM